MNDQDIGVIQTATLASLNAQIGRTLTLALTKGWKFPTTYDLGVTVLGATALVTKVKARMDSVVLEQTITSTDVAADIAKLGDALVAAWLALHASSKPTKKSRVTT